MLTIYADQISQRLSYVLTLIFHERNVAYQIVSDHDSFKKAALPKVAYSDDSSFEHYPKIYPSTLLFEDKIKKQMVLKSEWMTHEVLSFNGVPDILASIFYVISLYDDYLQEEKDHHNRNIGSRSLLYKMNWLEKLMVERWSEQFIDFIEQENGCQLKTQAIPFKIVPTFDIDNTFAYRYKKGWRKFLSIGKDVLKMNLPRLRERKAVLSGHKKDPYDTFDQIERIARNGFDVKVFWLLGDYGKFDRNLAAKNLHHQNVIKQTDGFTEVGLHPSYASNESETVLEKEKHQIEKILVRKVNHSRQHFLKIDLPTTFERLSNVGFSDDYSLGYADQLGFRAGIARPFVWFNLKENKVSNLKLHPISYMDGTLNEYMELTIEEAVKTVRNLKKEVKTYGGNFVALWHNETIGDYGKWKGWNEVLAETLKTEEIDV